MVSVGKHQGAVYETLRRELSAELWGRIVFKQGLTSQQVGDELGQAALMIHPTRVDVSPNTVKEAVVAGVPVVASAVGGIPDYVVPGENGWLFDSGDLEGCIQAIREACRHPLFGQGLVQAQTLARLRVYLSPETMGDRFRAAYRRVWSGGAKRPSA
jgi:glycosyltransferase involved in cell wall biosynthesis